MSNPLAKLSDEVLQARLTNAETELTFARDAFAKAQDVCHRAYEKWNALNEESMARKLAAENDISLILQAIPETKAGYNRYVSLLTEYGLCHGGYWAATNQRAVKVRFKKQDCDKNRKQIEGLKLLLPYILPIPEVKDEKDKILVGCKPVDIFEHTLSEGGVYQFYVRPDNTVILSFTRYYRTTYTEIGDFDAAMKYIQQHHWYDSDDSSDRYHNDY